MRSTLMMQAKSNIVRQAEYAPMAMLALAQREGEDAKLCGLTRSLHRRLLALNVQGTLRDRKPITSVTVNPLLIKRIA